MPKPVGSLIGIGCVLLYFLITIVIGLIARNHSRTANDYLNATRSLPLWIVIAAYLAANCGALDIVGMSAMAAQYGVQAFHFYWSGAIPAMVFLALWMMPVYHRSGVRSVPEYLALRFGPSLQLLNSCLLAFTILLLAGVSLYAIGQVLEVLGGLSFSTAILLSGSVVLVYVLLGGLKATIYNEVFQLAVILAGLIPLAVLTLHQGLPPHTATSLQRWHLWEGTPLVSKRAPLDVLGVSVGLGFVLSFGYWCTDFVQMQRAFTAKTERDARQVPLWAGFGKLGFSLLVVVPGLAASRILTDLGNGQRFDQALPRLMALNYGPAMVGLGLTAMIASLMSGLAANVSAFAALWTEDIYRGRLVPFRPDRHYLWVGRGATAFAILASLLTSYIDFLFNNLMEHVQLIFSVFGAPFFAIFMLGMGTRKTTERGAIAGLVSGVGVALLHAFAVARDWLHYGSVMSANFYVAIYAFSTALGVGWVVSCVSPDDHLAPDKGLVFHWRTGARLSGNRLLWTLSAALLLACAALNLLWR